VHSRGSHAVQSPLFPTAFLQVLGTLFSSVLTACLMPHRPRQESVALSHSARVIACLLGCYETALHICHMMRSHAMCTVGDCNAHKCHQIRLRLELHCYGDWCRSHMPSSGELHKQAGRHLSWT
jgi:hypothetical protein